MNTDREFSEQQTKQSRWGFRGMTVRDWLQLLIVPLALVVIGFLFSVQQDARQQRIEDQRAEAERELAEQRAQDEALQAYLDQMGTLLLEKDLRASEGDSEVRTLARARTLTMLRRLDASRKAAIWEFLAEAELIQRVEGRGPIIRLRGADLSGTNLQGTSLTGPDLSEANLSGAKLSFSFLEGAILEGANLRGANLRQTSLKNASLEGADVSGANLRGAYLGGTSLFVADLSGANLLRAHLLSDAYLEYTDLSRADLSSAELNGTDLSWANLSEADLMEANLSGADLMEANLSGADLKDANLDRADLSGADLRDAYLAGANLRYARGVTKETLEKHTGSLEALRGTAMPTDQYVTYEFEPAFAFVMGEDWETLPPETTDQLGIQTGPAGGQLLFTNPSDVFDLSNPSGLKEVAGPQNVKEWVSWFQSHPKLASSKPVPVSVGGASGMRIDVTPSSTKKYDPYCRQQPCLPLYPSGVDPRCTTLGNNQCKSWIISSKGFKDRYLIVNVGGETVVIDVAAQADKFDEFLPKAQKMLDTVEWKSE